MYIHQTAYQNELYLLSILLIELSQQNIKLMEQTLSRIHRRGTTRNELQSTYNRLNQFIDALNDKINGRIQMVQQTYLQDYKSQVKLMAEQLKNIRTVLDEELLRQRSNQRLFYLEEERDFFRGQVMKLNAELTGLNRSNERLKEQLDQAQAEAKNYKNLVYGLQLKIQRIHGQAFETHKLKQITSMPVIERKQSLSVSPTKSTLTKFSPQQEQSLTARPVYRSVDLRSQQIKELKKGVVDRQLKRREQILQECIKDIKKKIFYRTLDDGMSGKKHFDSQKKVGFQKFTRTDKEDLIRSILSNSQILEDFYNFMTSKKDDTNSPQHKFPKQPTKFGFSDKIFKIKLCGITK